MRNLAILIVSAFTLPFVCHPQLAATTPAEPVSRSHFVLKLHLDKAHDYEQTFDRVPYVAKNEVHLFAGETFGINVTISNDLLSGIAYQPDPTRAEVEFKFTQEKSQDGFIMVLVIHNKLKHKLLFDAHMSVPGKNEVYETSILPVPPDLNNFETWPHPIVQLTLSNFRFSEAGSN